MRDAPVKTIYLKDYRKPDFLIRQTELAFSLYEDEARVKSRIHFYRNPEVTDPPSDLVLNGEELQLVSVAIEGADLEEGSLGAGSYVVDEASLTLFDVPDEFVFECETLIKPQENTRLEGLYKSSSMFCTQCEAEGFRRITYYLDRPDVMTRFTTRIEADRSAYPVLLSNGNLIEQGDTEEGRHYAVWEDPFAKPCYLFALVAGDLAVTKDSFTTMSGREIDLRIFVDHKNHAKTQFALDSLKRAMKWDEEVYGREYDLDIFMIVAVDDFNMGAMENKGLNVFNSSCVLASPETATDSAYQRIEGIVAHEYFHNWSGNRVTCRDWFQLSLKEGFTVFRDSEFTADTHSRVVKRIDDVNLLRSSQFAEDAGPMSHPVRPASYMEISNFYTLTVYEKGAEVVRMIHRLVGAETFRRGSDLYFARHDGSAVTTEDFVAAMAEVSGQDFSQFQRWYDQAGTPVVDVESEYDEQKDLYTLKFRQSCPPTPGQETKLPFVIPVELGLIGPDGKDMSFTLPDGTCCESSYLFVLDKACQELSLKNVAHRPVPSLLRGFSAPVKLRYEYSEEELLFLAANDSDGFNRWDAGQKLALKIMFGMIRDFREGDEVAVDSRFVEACRLLLNDSAMDKAVVAKMLQLPSEAYLIEMSETADVEAICFVREKVREVLAAELEQELLRVYFENSKQDGQGSEAIAARALKNAVLSLLAKSGDESIGQICRKQMLTATNLTDELAALAALVHGGDKALATMQLDEFYKKWQHDAQVMEQWLAVQSGSSMLGSLSHIKVLLEHEMFDWTNPNKVRSVVGVFCSQNLAHFHVASGEGYAFLADSILYLDDLNPQIASRMVSPLSRWRKFDAGRQSQMKAQLRRIMNKPNLSKDVYEIVDKSLKD